MASKQKSQFTDQQKQLHELLRMRMELNAMKKRINEDFNAMLAQLENLLPEDEPRKKITNWKKHTAKW